MTQKVDFNLGEYFAEVFLFCKKEVSKMTEKEILEIWRRGNYEDILKLKSYLQKVDSPYRIVTRRKDMVEGYFQTHRPEHGFSYDPIIYEWDDKVYILERLD